MVKYLIILLVLPFASKSQNVFITQFQNQSNEIVYVTNYISEADLIVYINQFPTYGQNNGLWYFVNSEPQANVKIYFTNNRSQSTLIIAYTQFISQAGWVRKSRHF